MSGFPEIIVLTGPTASGKTAIARRLLERFPELTLISCDSRKVYRFMDIGTAKPPPELRQHYRLIDIRMPDETYSAQDFALDAEREIKKALESGSIPLVVGGTILYLKALFEGFFESPPIEESIREKLRERLEREGTAALYDELQKIDPETAAKVHPNDWFRIIRALEVFYQTGKPISVVRRENQRQPMFRPVYFFNAMPRPQLYERINRRVDVMMERGFLDEVRNLMEMGYDLSLPSMNTLGYRELYLHLQGKMYLETAVRLTKKRTRTFARRQFYFSRSLKGIRYVPPEEIFDALVAAIESCYA